MTEQEAFLRAILEEPEDVSLRRIYADWLEDHGDPRAEFIRLQCDLDELADDAPGRWRREVREQALLAEHEEEWAAGLKELVAYWSFRRGFVEEVGASVEQFLRHGAELFALTPLRELHLWGADRVSELAECPLLARLRHLDLSGVALGTAGPGLAASPHLAGLRSLNLACAGVDDAAARALAASPHLAGLTELYLGGNRLGDAGAQALAASRHLRSLTALDVRDNPIGPAGLEALWGRYGPKALLGPGVDW